MAKRRSSSKKKNGIVKLKIVAEKLRKSLLLGRKWNSFRDEHDEIHDSPMCLKMFLMLLEQAEEEYGFDREGALTIPCRPSELERILAEQWQEADSNANVNWSSCEATIQSY
ncbi:hypothetical protein CRYUN_Cryun25bG0120200 [Craigia yunnanensis]